AGACGQRRGAGGEIEIDRREVGKTHAQRGEQAVGVLHHAARPQPDRNPPTAQIGKRPDRRLRPHDEEQRARIHRRRHGELDRLLERRLAVFGAADPAGGRLPPRPTTSGHAVLDRPLSRAMTTEKSMIQAKNHHSLVRPAASRVRCARDDLAGALAELSEIDGRDLAAFLKQRGYDQLGVREGPPFVPMLFSGSLFVRHGNTKRFPSARSFFINERSAREFPPPWARAASVVPNYILNS